MLDFIIGYNFIGIIYYLFIATEITNISTVVFVITFWPLVFLARTLRWIMRI